MIICTECEDGSIEVPDIFAAMAAGEVDVVPYQLPLWGYRHHREVLSALRLTLIDARRTEAEGDWVRGRHARRIARDIVLQVIAEPARSKEMRAQLKDYLQLFREDAVERTSSHMVALIKTAIAEEEKLARLARRKPAGSA